MADAQIDANRRNDLVVDPEDTFFIELQKRFLNFGKEMQTVSSQQGGEIWNSIQTFTITPSSYDLLTDLELKITLPVLSTGGHATSSAFIGYTNSVGHAIIKSIKFYINGQLIDQHTGEWMEIWDELTLDNDSLKSEVGKYDSNIALRTNATVEKTLIVPLRFWFCRNWSMALPCKDINEIKIEVSTRTFAELVYTDDDVTSTATGSSMNLIATYVKFDPEVSDSLHKNVIDYFKNKYEDVIIDTVQHLSTSSQTGSGTSKTITLNSFSSSLKELFWVAQLQNTSTLGKNYFRFSHSNGTNVITNAAIKISGNEIINQPSTYFTGAQPDAHHSSNSKKHIHCFCWALHPESPKLTGGLGINDYTDLKLTLTTQSVTYDYNVYALTHKVLTIKKNNISISDVIEGGY